MRLQIAMPRFRARPVIPEGRIFIIGDVHGCYKTLRALLTKIEFGRKDVAYLLGDLIDNGPRIRQLLDFCMKMQKTGHFVVLRGNHEHYLLQALRSTAKAEWWLEHGGDKTLDSFGVDRASEIPAPYIAWIKKLPFVVRLPGSDGKLYVLSHAGVNPHAANPFRDTVANRNYVLRNRDKHEEHPKIVNIVGHTPKSLDQIKASLSKPKIILDGGCVYGDKLVALNLADMELTAVKNSD